MSETPPTVLDYFTEEIRELIHLGPVHALTWVSQRDPGCWMQVSVHDGTEHYLTVLVVLPPHLTKQELDRQLGKTGRKQAQVNHQTCLIYYLAQSENSQHLLEQSAAAAKQCALIVWLLWKAERSDQLELLGVRGPRIPLYGDKRSPGIAGAAKEAKQIELSSEQAALPAIAEPGDAA